MEQTSRDTEFRGHLTSRLRESNKAAQAAAEERVADGVGRVEAALRTKLGQVQLQTQSLSEALGSINTELAKLAHAQQRISSMQAHLQDKLVVNRGRQQVRRDRPFRELTCDDVNRSLARQEALLGGLIQKLQRGSGLVSVDSGKLQDVRQRLAGSLKDKLSALRVDEAVLNVAAATNNEGTLVASKAPTNYLSSLTHSSGSQQAGGGDSSSGSQYRAAPLGAAKSSGGGLYPSRWRKQSDQLITEAQQLAVDSSRLRRAVKQMLHDCLSASQTASQQVDAALAAKLNTTGELRNQLASQLHHVQEEIEVAVQHRDTLKGSLQAKQYPLQQLEERLALRSGRPATEAVEDEVQAALAAEAAQLNAVSTQLNARLGAAGQQIAQLNSVSAALLQHIADKERALSLEEKVALMDGRKIAAVPPSPTVLSVASSVVSGYSCLGESASQISAAASRASTPACGARAAAGKAPASCAGSTTSSALVRIAALERELAAAKSESAQLRAMVDSKSQVEG